MFASLTGIGLASAAGLNAYVPLLVVGLLARYTDFLPLSPTWMWLEHPVTLIILGVLLVVEFVADKVPAVDTINDVLQTFIRPTSGGITFGAGASTFTLTEITGEASGISAVAGGVIWGAVIAGATIALFFHLAKAIARPVINVLTFGLGAPVVSFLEDVASFFVALLAVLLPLLIVIVFPLMLILGVWAIRKGGRVRAEKRAQKQDQRAASRTTQGPGQEPRHRPGMLLADPQRWGPEKRRG
ncbi:DUF4126 domain-containing protein [Nocardiopsis metallicus]|uniref:Putative membrane protein n=1 Tax=Nocardiopsis metallicus TaxID=179819 RepID=A0A840W920_9ACTN|nr:DUF4126 domain-containing protein [Nocardiopsis metallicus]MBB5491863.1 putative membrane protein [Nocardiopsis metallicus]